MQVRAGETLSSHSEMHCLMQYRTSDTTAYQPVAGSPEHNGEAGADVESA